MAFTNDEKGRIKYFLDYTDWKDLSPAIQIGFPSTSQSLFLVESAFDNLSPSAEQSAKKVLAECECIEGEMSAARRRFSTDKVDSVTMNRDEMTQLKTEMDYWVGRLASVMDSPRNRLSESRSVGGPYNSRVTG